MDSGELREQRLAAIRCVQCVCDRSLLLGTSNLRVSGATFLHYGCRQLSIEMQLAEARGVLRLIFCPFDGQYFSSFTLNLKAFLQSNR